MIIKNLVKDVFYAAQKLNATNKEIKVTNKCTHYRKSDMTKKGFKHTTP